MPSVVVFCYEKVAKLNRKMALILQVTLILLLSNILTADDVRDYEFSEPEELLIAQESRHYETIVKPPVTIFKPNGVTNSHRPQYNLDSLELNDDLFMYESTTKKNVIKNYKQTRRVKEGMIRDAVLRALERKDQVGKFAQILPIIRTMSGNQRVALASLVASQVTTPPGRQPLNLSQVRSMFGNNTITDPMLPILLDTANLIRRALRHGKEPREVKYPQAQFQRRSLNVDTTLDEDPFETGEKENNKTVLQVIQRNRNLRNRQRPTFTKTNTTKAIKDTTDVDTNQNNTNENSIDTTETNLVTTDDRNVSRISQPMMKPSKPIVETTSRSDGNITFDLAVEATNQSISEEIPVAEKLRSLNRYIDRKGNLIRRGTFPKPPTVPRRTVAESTITPIMKRRPIPSRKPPPQNDQAKCELFTNTLCLHTEDYPTEAIVQTIRRNKAAAGALLADFKDPGEGAVDGITAAQEAKYTAEHYLVSNRRGDTANRDFAGAGEAGFMCPSTVKYARPQRARATSGQWKYIVNTGEHTQTLRLEKCLKPKESCTYLTDNFKSKCVQVYNYHRLLTWDQQNGLHMDIFKVPTCCSCHIEGYSVSFPPLGHRVHETSSEHFPGEDLSSEHGNQAFESVQSTIQNPSISKNPPFNFNKPIEAFSPFADNHNLIPGSSLGNVKLSGSEDLANLATNPIDSYGNTYFPDSFNQASSVRNVKRPVPRNPTGIMALDSVTLPSYLEPPTPRAPTPFSFSKENSNKFKVSENQFKVSENQFKRGPIRPSRRPLRKKISGGSDDLVSSGSSSIGSYSGDHLESIEDFQEDSEEIVNENFKHRGTIAPKLHSVTTDINFSTFKPLDQSKSSNTKADLKKVNYNYHPIIDFFEEQGSDSDSIDREDNMQGFMVSPESEWKPVGHPPSRPSIASDTNSGRKKHK